MKKNITERQMEIFTFIRSVVDRRGIPPTMREIGEKFGIRSTNGVEGHLAALERGGLIKRDRGKSRGILLKAAERSTVSIPLLGRVAAGQPVLSPENRESDISLDLSVLSLKNARNLFAVKVKGDSMVDAHIMDGDVLIVRAQSSAQDRDIVVALWDGETSVKRFFAENGRIRLQPENSTMKPIFVETGELKILGRVIGVIRKV